MIESLSRLTLGGGGAMVEHKEGLEDAEERDIINV